MNSSRYNLSIADLPTDAMQSVIAATEASVGVGKIVRNWVKGLLIHVAHGFDCEHVIRRRHGRMPILTFIGTSADAEVAVYTFQFLYRELDSLVERALPKLKRQNKGWTTASLRYAYLAGAVKRIGERFHEQTQAVRAAEHNGCKDLILAKDRIIRSYMANAFPHIKVEYGRGRVISAGAFEKGYGEAGDIGLRPGITRNESEQSAITA